MNRVEELIAKYAAHRQLVRLLGLGLYVLSVLMIAVFVAKNAGITKAEVTRIAGHIGRFSVDGVFAERPYYLLRIFEPKSGEDEAWPAIVAQGISLARAHQLREINLSPGLWADDQLRMRFGEGLYPIRLERGRTSVPILFAVEERPASSCRLLERRPLVQLMKCP